ncbi:uncharacterized protein LOC109706012 [Ananas comosus]|uniref:Uncharacterized protein LOC109706012 n=1 Tax=Ananas comosus TaxID=4615 RepID=A0A6P5EGG3_ANACO|nr:uncharacterized protein LOC109706012 [Ananas comosus]
MSLANTKVVCWDRMLYMYLVGMPNVVRDRKINLNVPFLVWRRMAKDIKTSSQSERLPYPLIIMRILRVFDVDTRCSSYEHSLGVISETMFIKSSVQLQSQRSPPRRSSQQRSTPPSGPSRPSAEVSKEEMSVSSVYREQQRLSLEQERISGELRRIFEDQAPMVAVQERLTRQVGKLRRMMRAIFDKLGCCSADLPAPGADSD